MRRKKAPAASGRKRSSGKLRHNVNRGGSSLQAAAVLAGTDMARLEQAAQQLRSRGFGPVVAVRYGEANEDMISRPDSVLAGSSFCIPAPGLKHAHEAFAAGSAAAAAAGAGIVLFADTDIYGGVLPQLPLLALLRRAAGSRKPAAVMPDAARGQSFSSWSQTMILSAFMHWSLGGEARSRASMEQGCYVLNRNALKMLAGKALADPAEALASLLTAGGAAHTVQMPRASLPRSSHAVIRSEQPARCVEAIARIAERSGGARFAFPDRDRRREAVAEHDALRRTREEKE